MILQELKALAEREKLVSDPDFEPRPVTYIILLGKKGEYRGLQRTQGPELSGRNQPQPMILAVPTLPIRSSGVDSGFTVDNAKYLLGHGEAKDKSERVRQCAQAFKALIGQAASDTGDPALAAVLRFLEDKQLLDKCVKEAGEELKGNDLFAFEWAASYVHDRPKVRDWWKARRAKAAEGGQTAQCLVTGKIARLAELHPKVKNVPGATTAGVPLVSFNQDAFESYGLHGSENAPVSQEAAVACATALNRLLSERWPAPGGGYLPPRKVRLSDTSVAVFWARGDNPLVDCIAPALQGDSDEGLPNFAKLMAEDPQKLIVAVQSVHKGQRIQVDDPSPFFSLVLAGNQGRVALRDWQISTVGRVLGNLRSYFRDLDVPPADRGPLPLWALLKSLAPNQEAGRLPPDLGQQIFEAALFGRPFPRSILDAAVRRCRVEHRVSRERAALIQATLRRLSRKAQEAKDTMNESDRSVGYRLGQLLAELEAMQYYATGGAIDTGVAERYFSGACATPQAVFPRLLKLSMHHYHKARQLRPQAAIPIQRRIDALCSDILPVKGDGAAARAIKNGHGRVDGFPRHLALEEQGLFVLGYHAQRQAHFAATQDKKTAEHTAKEAA